jgi:dienelactone hydrolase
LRARTALALPVLLWLCAASPSPTAAQEPELAAYGQLPSFELLDLSPDGSRLAYVGTVGEERHVLVKSFADGQKLIDFTAPKGQKLRGLHWADNDHVLATVSMTTAVSLWGGERDEYFGVIAADLKTNQAWDVLKFPGGVANNAGRLNLVTGRVRARQVNGETWLYLYGVFASGAEWESRGRMMRINLNKRTHAIVETRDFGEQYDQLMDETGNLVAVSDYNDERRQWQIVAGTAGHLQPVISGEADIDVPAFQGISPDGQDIWLLTWKNGESTPVSVSLADGKPAASTKLRAGVHREAWDSVLLNGHSDRVVAGFIQRAAGQTCEFLDPVLDARWQRVVKALGGVEPTFISSSDDFSRVIVQVQAPTGPLYLLVDMATGKFITLGPRYRQLPAVGEVRAIEYAAADGLGIPAYLTMPAGRAAKGLPLVVMPHGGPQSRDGGGFDWWAQALAYEGYAVLQPNFRGSTVSEAFVAAGQGQWGRKMQTDLSDGVRHLASQGIVDPARVCIVGASYGGYAALAGVSLQRGIYRCAVAVAGVSDLHRLVKPSAGVRTEANIGARYLERWLGVSDVDDPTVDERSPLRHADAIEVPLLLIHGRDDMVVPYEQSRWMADELKRLHKTYKLVDLKAEDHWLSQSQTRLQMLQEVVAFLKTNNPPEAATPAGAGAIP